MAWRRDRRRRNRPKGARTGPSIPSGRIAGFADDASVDSADNAALFRHLFDGRMITAGGYTTELGVEAIAAGMADAVAFGRMFIANPDLPERIRTGAGLNQFDRSTSYGGGAHGYTDYPALEAPALVH
jgi:N-ethylmaleimide reductase